ncbi:hypothetical protein [Streptomyces sp. NPDC002580]|uniref:hypothetical protein n=1 Tax=Streptomyces sp. NPDC002580 TaxID=3364653 RepID=UPI0036819DE1
MAPSPPPADEHLSHEEADRLTAAADPDVPAAREHRLALVTEGPQPPSGARLRAWLPRRGSIRVEGTW